MRLLLKKNIMEMLDLMEHVQGIVSSQWGKGNTDQLLEWLTQLQESAMEIGKAIEAQEQTDKGLICLLEEYCELLYLLSQTMENGKGADILTADCGRKLEEIRRHVKQTDVQIKIAFFPYKYTMWDSLESIWRAACKDKRCECQVIPVPYYDKGEDGKLEEMHYEGESFPEEVPVLDYRDYSIDAENPDIVYIHNPYDEYNKVTCIHPAFFMDHLKKRGAVMVYVPYYMASACDKIENLGIFYRTKGAVQSDFIVLQSDKLKEAYAYCGIDDKKILVTGSPKIDKICELKKLNRKGIEKWQPIIKDRKVLLFCSSINDLLSDDNWIFQTNTVIDRILSDQSLALIWRPHPLLFQTLQMMKKDWMEEYQKLYEKIEKAENGIVDEKEDSGESLMVSDGMIGDFSSLVLQYTFLEKPALLLRGDSRGRNDVVFCDYFSHYFVPEGTTVDDFIQMIKEGKDEKKEERMRYAKASIANPNGTCGEKTHEAVIKKICFWE